MLRSISRASRALGRRYREAPGALCCQGASDQHVAPLSTLSRERWSPATKRGASDAGHDYRRFLSQEKGNKGKKGKKRKKRKKGKKRKDEQLASNLRQNEEHEKRATELGMPWKIVTVSVLERLPVIQKDLVPWEEAYFEMRQQHREETRYRYPDDFWTPRKEDTEEYPEPAPRVTTEDLSGDRVTTWRQLQHTLYLVGKPSKSVLPDQFADGFASDWHMPLGEKRDGETMVESSVRHLTTHFGLEEDDVFTIGNAPFGHLFVPFSEDYQKQANLYGAKVFFYKAQILETGKITIDGKDISEYHWVTKEELSEYLGADFYFYAKQILRWSPSTEGRIPVPESLTE